MSEYFPTMQGERLRRSEVRQGRRSREGFLKYPHVPAWNLLFCENHFPCLQTEGPPVTCLICGIGFMCEKGLKRAGSAAESKGNLSLKIMVGKCWSGWVGGISCALLVGMCVVMHARKK